MGLEYDQLLIVDDASPVLPSWSDVDTFEERHFPTARDVLSTREIVLYTHSERHGRRAVFDFPGWYRSFAFGVKYGIAHDFDKIIHVESDAHLISDRIRDYFNNFATGWVGMWCSKYNMPEIAIQVAAGRERDDMLAFVDQSYDHLVGRNHEELFPFTHVEKSFVGDRYGEDVESIVPSDSDFSAQTLAGKDETFYWWLPRDTRRIAFPFTSVVFGHGWAEPEAGYVWMTGPESVLSIASREIGAHRSLHFFVTPCLFEERQNQRLFVLVNDVLCAEVSINSDACVEIDLTTLRQRAGNMHIRFFHPDAFVPAEIGAHPERRELSCALDSIVFLT